LEKILKTAKCFPNAAATFDRDFSASLGCHSCISIFFACVVSIERETGKSMECESIILKLKLNLHCIWRLLLLLFIHFSSTLQWIFYSISNLQRCFYYICAIFSWLLLAFPFVRPTPLTRFAYFVFSIKLTRFPFSLHFLWPSSGCLHLHLNYIGNRNLKTIRWDFLHLGLSGNFDCGIGLNFPQTRCKNLILFVNDPKELLVKNENREGNMIPCGCKEWKKKKGKAKIMIIKNIN